MVPSSRAAGPCADTGSGSSRFKGLLAARLPSLAAAAVAAASAARPTLLPSARPPVSSDVAVDAPVLSGQLAHSNPSPQSLTAEDSAVAPTATPVPPSLQSQDRLSLSPAPRQSPSPPPLGTSAARSLLLDSPDELEEGEMPHDGGDDCASADTTHTELQTTAAELDAAPAAGSGGQQPSDSRSFHSALVDSSADLIVPAGRDGAIALEGNAAALSRPIGRASSPPAVVNKRPRSPSPSPPPAPDDLLDSPPPSFFGDDEPDLGRDGGDAWNAIFAAAATTTAAANTSEAPLEPLAMDQRPPKGRKRRKVKKKNKTAGQLGEDTGAASATTPRGHPPRGYICRLCGVPGHFMTSCAKFQQRQRTGDEPAPPPEVGATAATAGSMLASATATATATSTSSSSSTATTSVPPGYICHLCGVPGHHITACPAPDPEYLASNLPPGYRCHACGVEGAHHIRFCPSHTAGGRGSSAAPRRGPGAHAPSAHQTEQEQQQQQQRPQPLCRYIQSGRCTRGAACSFSHDVSAQPCAFLHLRGGCARGAACPYSHAPLDPAAADRLRREHADFKARKTAEAAAWRFLREVGRADAAAAAAAGASVGGHPDVVEVAARVAAELTGADAGITNTAAAPPSATVTDARQPPPTTTPRFVPEWLREPDGQPVSPSPSPPPPAQSPPPTRPTEATMASRPPTGAAGPAAVGASLAVDDAVDGDALDSILALLPGASSMLQRAVATRHSPAPPPTARQRAAAG